MKACNTLCKNHTSLISIKVISIGLGQILSMEVKCIGYNQAFVLCLTYVNTCICMYMHSPSSTAHSWHHALYFTYVYSNSKAPWLARSTEPVYAKVHICT